ncbi:MAG: hypothetical protein ACREIV_11730, partial [Planctomycetaceae bacterium]
MDDLKQLTHDIETFNAGGQKGADPVAGRYSARRELWSLFEPVMSDDEIEALRPYIFSYDTLP